MKSYDIKVPGSVGTLQILGQDLYYAPMGGWKVLEHQAGIKKAYPSNFNLVRLRVVLIF